MDKLNTKPKYNGLYSVTDTAEFAKKRRRQQIISLIAALSVFSAGVVMAVQGCEAPPETEVGIAIDHS